MEVTGKQLKEIAYIRRITSWTCDHCSVCDYPIKYVFQGSYPEVIFDPGCTCTIEVAKLDRYDHSSWDEVAALINKITDFGISFDNDIETIRDHLVDKIVGSKKYNKFFSKFFDRIYLLMNQYNHVHQYEQNISSDGDELNKFNEMCDGLPKKRTKEELHEINEKNKKVKVNPDDHIGMSPKVRYHGYKKIGKKFQSDEDESKFHFI